MVSHKSFLSHINHTKTTKEKKLRSFIQGGGFFSPACLVLSKRHVQEKHGVERAPPTLGSPIFDMRKRPHFNERCCPEANHAVYALKPIHRVVNPG